MLQLDVLHQTAVGPIGLLAHRALVGSLYLVGAPSKPILLGALLLKRHVQVVASAANVNSVQSRLELILTVLVVEQFEVADLGAEFLNFSVRLFDAEHDVFLAYEGQHCKFLVVLRLPELFKQAAPVLTVLKNQLKPPVHLLHVHSFFRALRVSLLVQVRVGAGPVPRLIFLLDRSMQTSDGGKGGLFRFLVVYALSIKHGDLLSVDCA